MDQACGKAEQLKDALMAFGGDGVFTKLDRKSEDNLKVNGKDVRVPGHGENIEKQLTKLVEVGLCKKAKDVKDNHFLKSWYDSLNRPVDDCVGCLE